jgi:hypothetical protein
MVTWLSQSSSSPLQKLYTQLLGLAALNTTQARGTKKVLFMLHHTSTSQIAMFFRRE